MLWDDSPGISSVPPNALSGSAVLAFGAMNAVSAPSKASAPSASHLAEVAGDRPVQFFR